MTGRQLDSLAPDSRHQGIVAVTRGFAYAPLDSLGRGVTAPLLLALDQLQDPHNLGAIARSALAFGADGLIICERRSAQVTAAAQKASAGALQSLP
ncbi:MAG: 23S rRNA (guanosine(2251)-2'-O)-methyltransferase RlmB, partial [Deltaproteobacteria bacterium]